VASGIDFTTSYRSLVDTNGGASHVSARWSSYDFWCSCFRAANDLSGADGCVAPAAPTVDDEVTGGYTDFTTCDDAASSVNASWTKAAGCSKMFVSENTDDIGDSTAGKLSASAGSPWLALQPPLSRCHSPRLFRWLPYRAEPAGVLRGFVCERNIYRNRDT